MRDDPSVIALATRAAGDDQQAWDELIERYAPLVWATCTRYRLSNHDIEDVGQSVWLLLVAQLGKLSERPRCPAGLATTIKRECLRVVTAIRKSQQLGSTVDDAPFADERAIDEEILIAEGNAALRTAFAELPPHGQHLPAMLFRDPPCSYSEISATLGIPIGSIGPYRARCLERLLQSPSLTAFGESEFSIGSPGGGHDA
jgi:RNA polymerase sigma factor (sigma-70 family)